MNRLSRVSLLLALCCLAGATARAQEMPSTPPIKMGLWESTVTTAVGGMTIPPHTIVTQSCMAKEEWAKTLERMNETDPSHCTLSNKSITAQKITFDMSCAYEHGGVVTGHLEMLVDDSEHTHGSAHMKAEGGTGGQPITVDTTLSTHYVAADCGEVKPGDAKIINSQ